MKTSKFSKVEEYGSINKNRLSSYKLEKKCVKFKKDTISVTFKNQGAKE